MSANLQTLANLVGTSREMQEVRDQIVCHAAESTPLLVVGEPGTGRVAVAQAVHGASQRQDRPFQQVYCAALPAAALARQLFAHANDGPADKPGLLQLAAGGSLLLAGADDLPTTLQLQLLTALRGEPPADVRLLLTTEHDAPQLAAEGRFHPDWAAWLAPNTIYLPPLRKRKTDIVLLADHFLPHYAQALGKDVRRLASATIDMLMSYHWPGNVRELENSMARAVQQAEGSVIYPYHLPPTLQTAEAGAMPVAGDLKSLVSAFERDLIRDALKSTRGNVAAAARALGTTPRILGYKIRTYQIPPRPYD
ncbi:MAG: sigma 54-interacting transcriptional regulator [Kiritimatiellia bacterium]|jgi:Nif-specific regulatory protein|nr:sigma-54-dependent Fis family transcriptional regulator [Kiritimatiellia bacterium]OQC59142.1 MAG: Nitrogen fixation protein VnfA [Verrucomicrobia bacterium ADurb.Bin018]MBP9572493.1 sigma-54-dependent Fis family transcriptional regulator [Kiritimatiellia bacterium]HOE01215.1 sigma 54-interacting transcriptional regulator [Kiritimatiellia bacterium]HQM23352.1 sigma 54-interacting transcriptional regulator [Kiritimatiellia bacterium]